MRNLKECRDEVFFRSARRIAVRRRVRNHILSWSSVVSAVIALCLIIPNLRGDEPLTNGNDASDIIAGVQRPNSAGNIGSLGNPNYGFVGNPDQSICGTNFGSVESFSFTLTWGCYGISSYDSSTGILIKEKNASHPESYTTVYQLPEEQKLQIYQLLKELMVTAYPNSYKPHGDGVASNPSMTLILSVKTDAVNKTVTAENIAMTFESKDIKGQRFLSACKAIADILTESPEWKALPEYEVIYD